MPTFSSFCRGCPWDYTDAETDWTKVDAFEVATGPAGLRTEPRPGPNPFTPLAIDLYEHALDTGAKIAAVGVSDSHTAGDAVADFTDITGAPLGMATTVVHAPELSEAGIAAGIRARHTYVKVWGNAGADLRFEALDASGKVLGIMGDAVGGAASLRMTVLGADPWPGVSQPVQLVVLRDRVPILIVPVASGHETLTIPVAGAARYRLQLQRGSSLEALSSPIWVTGA